MELATGVDDKEYKYSQLYSECSVTLNRSLYILRVIAGLAPNDPRYEEDLRKVALDWLKAHNVDKPLMPFMDND